MRGRLDEIRRFAGASRASRPGSRKCAGCDCPIPAKRLRALPGATLCIGCQREAEKGRPF